MPQRNPVDVQWHIKHSGWLTIRNVVIAWRPEMPSADFYRNLRSSAKRLHPTLAPRPAIIGTADFFTNLVELHQKRRRFLNEIARKDN
jgi:hypothetical protein